MIEVKLDDRIIKVQPDLTLDKFMKIQKNPIKYNNTEELLSLYLDVEVDEIKDLPKDNVKFIENFITQNVINQDTDKMTFTFELDGITYGFENDWKNIKWGQWVDMEVFSSKDKIFDNIHVIMSLLYRPVLTQKGTKYTIEPYKSSTVMERAELFLTKIKSLDNLTSVGGYINAYSSDLESLGNLTYVGGYLRLELTDVDNFGNLKKVGGDLYLGGSKILFNYKSAKKIRSILDVGGTIKLKQ